MNLTEKKPNFVNGIRKGMESLISILEMDEALQRTDDGLIETFIQSKIENIADDASKADDPCTEVLYRYSRKLREVMKSSNSLDYKINQLWQLSGEISHYSNVFAEA
jgi:hypothetical protein